MSDPPDGEVDLAREEERITSPASKLIARTGTEPRLLRRTAYRASG